MTKIPKNILYLKQKLYTLKMEIVTSIEDHMDEPNRLILDIENIEIKLDDEQHTLLLIKSLTSTCEVLSYTNFYNKN